MKTPEQLANDYANAPWPTECCQECRYLGFLAGYKAGSEVTEQEIADIIVDIREREARERRHPPHYKERQDRIWEKVRVKLIGIF